MDKIIERLKTEFTGEDARYAYADTITNAFLIGQIKALREERNLTQEQLAELVGTQQSGISRWMNSGFSTCKVETLRKFARAYGVRLRISFEEFGTLPSDVGDFTEERLAPRKFEDDPAFKEQPQEVAAAKTQTAPSLAGLTPTAEYRAWFERLYSQEAVHAYLNCYAGKQGGLVNPYANLAGALPISNTITVEQPAPQKKKAVLIFVDNVDERKGMSTVAGSEWLTIPKDEAA